MTTSPWPGRVAAVLVAIAPAMSPAQAASRAKNPPPAAWHLSPARLASDCRVEINRARNRINAALTRKPALQTFANTLKPIEDALATLSNGIGPHAFLYNVSPDAQVRDSSTACSQWQANFSVEIGADPRIFAAATRINRAKTLNPVDRQLVKIYLENWRHTGAGLDSATRVRTTALFQRLNDVQRDFMVHLAADSTRVDLSTAEAASLPAQLRATLIPKGDRFLIDANESTIGDFVHTETSRDARQRFITAYDRRGDRVNVDRLRTAVAIRDTLAHLLGFPSWAAFQLDVKMARTPQRVTDFLHQVDDQLKPRAQEELDRLAPLARRDGISGPLQPWDVGFYNEQYRKAQYTLDNEVVREYFPVDHVIDVVMQIYQELLGLTFKEVQPADAWAPGVREFIVTDATTGTRFGTFYLDLFPRPNKYGHFADFSLVNARRLASGAREFPVNAIVGNWPTPAPGAPSLLTHDDVVTFFHEFGHAMSALCDNSPYVTIGSGWLRQDFVEALSQMLENWMWQPAVLKRVSQHVKTGGPLPDSLIRTIIALKHLTNGLDNTRQASFGLFDMALHTSGASVDPNAIWDRFQREATVVPPIDGTWPVASFGHFMGGYDAGYYGYLWSLVYAQDMFTRFERAGVMDRATGRAYRDLVLAPGATQEPDALLKRFLGRSLSYDAFFREMGLNGPHP